MKFTWEDETFLRRALTLAANGLQTVSPNPAVGALVVRDNQVIAEGWHIRAGEQHAETVALARAGEEARGAALYVNLEPCCHYGRTPPCCDAIIRAGIRRIVACTSDPNPKVNGGGFRALDAAGIELSFGFLVNEAERLNEVYFHFMRTRRPFVHVKAGMSLDGRIATSSGKSQWITSDESRRYAHRLRQRYDAILVGAKTLAVDNPRLDVRVEGGGVISRVVLDSRLSLDPGARIFQAEAGGAVIIATTADAPERKIREIRDLGADVIVCAEKDGRVAIDDLLAKLGERTITGMMVEGGGETIAAFFAAGAVQKVTFVLAPLIIGGHASVPVVGGAEIDELAEAWRLKDLRSFSLGPDIAIEGYTA